MQKYCMEIHKFPVTPLITSKEARFPGFKTKNFFKRFSQSVDM